MQRIFAVVIFHGTPRSESLSFLTSALARQPDVGAIAWPSASVSSRLHAPVAYTLIDDVPSLAPGDTLWSIANTTLPVAAQVSGLGAGRVAGGAASAPDAQASDR